MPTHQVKGTSKFLARTDIWLCKSVIWRTIISNSVADQGEVVKAQALSVSALSKNTAGSDSGSVVSPVSLELIKNYLAAGVLANELLETLLEKVMRPGQYLGNEWGAHHKSFAAASVRLALVFPDSYELGMSNFGQRILYNIVNRQDGLMADRAYAPGEDLEALMREHELPLWAWESRRRLNDFELIGFSLQYELTYTNVLNMLELSAIPIKQTERKEIFPLIFAGGPSTVNPEPMADFMDFFIIGDGEQAVPQIMNLVAEFKRQQEQSTENADAKKTREKLLLLLAAVPGVYVPSLYKQTQEGKPPEKIDEQAGSIPNRIDRQIMPLNSDNQPVEGPISYLSLIHDRQTLEVRRGCDRGCRFCQPGYTFLPVRERSTADVLKASKEALKATGHDEYSMLSLCVSDYTALHETVRALNREHSQTRSSLSFPSQRADRMNLDIAAELKVVRKSGITLAPEAGTERLRAVINKGLSHQQIISAVESAYKSGWSSIKLYFMLGLPTERDEDLEGIVDILVEATKLCREIRNTDKLAYKRNIEFTCTVSNFVPKPHTPFQWFGQITPEETLRRQNHMRQYLKQRGLRNVRLNFTNPQTSLMEVVISRGSRSCGELIYQAFKLGAKFDAWDDKFVFERWQKAAEDLGMSLIDMACTDRTVGSAQPWDVVNVGLNNWWLVREWEKAMAASETAPCTENTCHACGVCTELDTTHQLAFVKPELLKKNPFVKELAANKEDEDGHPSLFFMEPSKEKTNKVVSKMRFQFSKLGQMRFISHLDLQHLFERAGRRAEIQLAYTEGFNPSPKIALASALALFMQSEAEIGEMELAETLDADEFVRRMNEMLPKEIQIASAKTTGSQTSLASQIGRAKYRAIAQANGAGQAAILKQRISEVLASTSLEIAHENKNSFDIRPGIFELNLVSEAPPAIELQIACGSRLHVKVQDLLGLINPNLNWQISRTGLFNSEGIPLFELN